MVRRTSALSIVAAATMLASCGGGGSTSPSATPVATATGAPTPTTAASATPANTPSPSASGSAATITLKPTSISALGLSALPGTGGMPNDCPPGSPADTSCFSVDPIEVDPTQAGGASFTESSAAATIAQPGSCSNGTVTCTGANGFLVYGMGAGRTNITVTGTGNATATLPVTITETNGVITLQNLANAKQIQIVYAIASGGSGNVTSYDPITGTNPTLHFYNVPVPVDTQLTFLRVIVNDANGNQIGVATMSNVMIPSGQVNTETFTVSPTTT